MKNDEISLYNACTDLVTLKNMEAFPLQLMTNKLPGVWIGVREFCLQIGIDPGDLGSEAFATWLPDPMGHVEYAIVFFYDDESKWSMAAHFNRGRLAGRSSQNQMLQPASAAISNGPCPTSLPYPGPK